MSDLDALYARIPAVTGCKTGCSDCCGPVPMRADEARRVAHPMQPERFGPLLLTPTNCMTCAYSSDAGCAIYASRPLMCRLFGAVADEPRLQCPHGAQAKRPLSADAARRLVAEYQQVAA